MSDVYNPEAQVVERIAALELEARELVAKRDQAQDPRDRAAYERQLAEVEDGIEKLKRQVRDKLARPR